MTILAFPSIRGAKVVEWYLQANTQAQESPFDGTVQTLGLPGSRWRGTVSYTLQLADFRTLQAFLASLGGRSGRFTYTPPQSWRRATVAIPGPVLIDGAGQSGSVVYLDGLPVTVPAFEAGDWISWLDPAGRSQLHMVTAQVNTDGSGNGMVLIAPAIRAAPADDTAVEIVSPKGVFMLTGDDQGRMVHSGDNPSRASVSFEIIEALV